MSKLKPPVKLNFEGITEPDEKFDKILFAINNNGDEVNKALKTLDFENNFNAYTVNKTITNEDTYTFRHNLGYKPTLWIVHSDSRIERTEFVTKTSKQLQLKFYFKSTFLTAAVSASQDIYVANPYIFKVGDSIFIDTDERSVTEVDYATRKIVVDTNTTQAQFDNVRLKTDTVDILMM